MKSVTTNMGFSIVDVLFSLCLFSIAAFTYLYLVSISNTAVARQGSSIWGSVIAENIAEDLSMKGKGDTALSATYNYTHYRYFRRNLEEVTSVQDPKYTAYWQVVENQPIPGNITVNITVSWKDGSMLGNFKMRVIR